MQVFKIPTIYNVHGRLWSQSLPSSNRSKNYFLQKHAPVYFAAKSARQILPESSPVKNDLEAYLDNGELETFLDTARAEVQENGPAPGKGKVRRGLRTWNVLSKVIE